MNIIINYTHYYYVERFDKKVLLLLGRYKLLYMFTESKFLY
jgi:hypothetical protein